MMERINAKIEGQEIARIEVEEAAETEVVDLVARLRQSLEKGREEPRVAEGSG
jgi:non-homologous end joining protein Ku